MKAGVWRIADERRASTMFWDGRERKEERDESRRLANRRRKAGVYNVLGSTNTSLTLRLAADHVKSTVVLNDASGGE